MMKKELPYFWIGNYYGGYQPWFKDFMMKIGGCAAVAACDSCIFLELHKGMQGLYPFAVSSLGKEEYIQFAMRMKPYLRPRLGGIDRLSIYTEGFGNYLYDQGVTGLVMEEYPGDRDWNAAAVKVQEQIDSGFLIPFLTLKHKDRTFKNYTWHWYLVTGYEWQSDRLMVKAVTYNCQKWLDFEKLWDTGYEKKGGMILYGIKDC